MNLLQEAQYQKEARKREIERMKREFQDLKARNFKRKEGEPKKAVRQEQPAELPVPEPPRAPEVPPKIEDETVKKFLGPHISHGRRDKRKQV